MLLINHFQEDDYQKVILNSSTAWQHRVPCSPQGGTLDFLHINFLLNQISIPAKSLQSKHIISHVLLTKTRIFTILQLRVSPKLSQNHSPLAGVRDIRCLKK